MQNHVGQTILIAALIPAFFFYGGLSRLPAGEPPRLSLTDLLSGSAKPKPAPKTDIPAQPAATAQTAPQTTPDAPAEPEAGAAAAPVEPALRDPFWPVNYVLRMREEDDEKKKEEEERKRRERETLVSQKYKIKWPPLKLKGITVNPRGGYLAILDKVGLVAEGEIIQLIERGRVFRWKVDKITPSRVKSIRIDERPVAAPKPKSEDAKGNR